LIVAIPLLGSEIIAKDNVSLSASVPVNVIVVDTPPSTMTFCAFATGA